MAEVWQDPGRMEALLLRGAMFLFLSVTVAAIGYYTWRKTSGREFHFLKVSRKQIGYISAMSLAIPILAASFQSTWVISRGIRFHTAMLWDLFNPGLWIFVTVEAAITFLLFWLFAKVAPWFRWPVLLLCFVLWTYIGFETIAVTKA